MSFFFREPSDSPREVQRLREVVEREDAAQPLDPVELDELPLGDLRA